VELALNDLAQKGWIGGKKLEIQWEDNEYEPRKAIAAFNKLVFMDKVNFIIITGSRLFGPWFLWPNKIRWSSAIPRHPTIRCAQAATIHLK